MKNNRIVRINDEILREVSIIIRSDLKDPRMGAMTSVVKVDTTNDLKYCKIYVSVLGDDKQKSDVMEALKDASGFIRKQIAARINLRVTPQMTFLLDDSLEYSIRINQLIKEVNQSADEGEDE